MTLFDAETLAGLERVGADVRAVSVAANRLGACFRMGGKVLLCGNGGSAADAQHLAAEFVGRFELERPGLPAVALTTDSSALTAIANDYGFEEVFARQIQALGREGDVVVVISTSGESANILAAARAAKAQGLAVVALCGPGASSLSAAADIAICVQGGRTASVQEGHLVVEHALCRAVDTDLFAAGDAPALQPTGVVTLDVARVLREATHSMGSTIVWTNGCFDLLHIGHLRSLEAARALGDLLVVGVNGDAATRSLKGPGRPLMAAAERAELVAALRPVAAVVVFEELTPEAALQVVRPDIHAKGADYAPPEGKAIPERAVVEAYGGRVVFLPLVPDRSTTRLASQLEAEDA